MPLPERVSNVTAYCALLALAVLQLGIALHHDQHSATELTSTCVTCVQLEQDDDALVASGVEVIVAPDKSRSTGTSLQRPASGSARYYQSRAPPVIS